MQKLIFYIFLISTLASCNKKTASGPAEIFYIGGYTSEKFDANGDGIYVCSLDSKTGEMKLLSTTMTTDPSYLVVNPNGKYVYAANESGGENPGTISAFKIVDDKGSLEFVNNTLSGGDFPCYMSFSADGKYILVANYGHGRVATVRIREDGGLSGVADVDYHHGEGPFKQRQEGPHAHFFGMGINDSTAFAIDLGTDMVVHYRLGKDGSIDSLASTSVIAGTGPRHLVFHPEHKWCYVLSEFTNKIEAFKYQDEYTPFQVFQVIGTTDYEMPFHTSVASAIKMHPNGKYLYAANRGRPTGHENSISMFSIDQKSGKLTLLGTMDTKGEVPRDFAIDPTGNFIVVANQFSENAVSFKIDLETGLLKDTGYELKVKSGTCVKFL